MKTNFDAAGINVKSQINIFPLTKLFTFNRLVASSLPKKPQGIQKLHKIQQNVRSFGKM